MSAIDLGNGYSLLLTRDGSGIRLTVVSQGEPYVCRKASRKELSDLLNGESATAFKGRLKLHVRGDQIDVEAKNQCLSRIPKDSLERAVAEALSAQPA